jgi:catechol 2,3-dioxygenase-like lactoylglutathione lyase family enzyme
MIDHISFAVSDLARSKAFYDEVLSPLGYLRIWAIPNAAGYGSPGCDEVFAIREQAGIVVIPADRCHVAFSAPARDSVERFHAAALAAGATDEGPPRLCPEYGQGYFAAFVRDPDGYRIEAVLHE